MWDKRNECEHPTKPGISMLIINILSGLPPQGNDNRAIHGFGNPARLLSAEPMKPMICLADTFIKTTETEYRVWAL